MHNGWELQCPMMGSLCLSILLDPDWLIAQESAKFVAHPSKESAFWHHLAIYALCHKILSSPMHLLQLFEKLQ